MLLLTCYEYLDLGILNFMTHKNLMGGFLGQNPYDFKRQIEVMVILVITILETLWPPYIFQPVQAKTFPVPFFHVGIFGFDYLSLPIANAASLHHWIITIAHNLL